MAKTIRESEITNTGEAILDAIREREFVDDPLNPGNRISKQTVEATEWLALVLKYGPIKWPDIQRLNDARGTKKFAENAIRVAAQRLEVVKYTEPGVFQGASVWALKEFANERPNPVERSVVAQVAEKVATTPNPPQAETPEPTPPTTPTTPEPTVPDTTPTPAPYFQTPYQEFRNKQGLTIEQFYATVKKPNGDSFSITTVRNVDIGQQRATKFYVIQIAETFDVEIEEILPLDDFYKLGPGQYRGVGSIGSIRVINEYMERAGLEYRQPGEEVTREPKTYPVTPKLKNAIELAAELDGAPLAIHIVLQDGVMTLSYPNGVKITTASFNGSVSL